MISYYNGTNTVDDLSMICETDDKLAIERPTSAYPINS